MTDETRVPIAKAKGRPLLQWVGKRPLREVRSFPAQLVERFASTAPAGGVSNEVDWSGWPDRFDRGGLLFHGDNKEVLAHLLANGFRGKVDLVYIDPPFDSGADYVRKVQLRGASGSVRLDGESHTLGEQIQYTDIWANDTYLQFMYERLLLIKELMSPSSSLWVHLDWRRISDIRQILDEVIGTSAFRNEVVWHYSGWNKTLDRGFERRHDTLLFYAKSDSAPFNSYSVPYESRDDYLKRRKQEVHVDEDGREYTLDTRDSGARQRKVYIDDALKRGKPLDDVWDLDKLNNSAKESVNFETQKPEALLERIVSASSNPGDIVLDCFIGSGTTAAVAQKLGRRWIGADINKGAIQTTEKRLAAIIEDQARAASSEQLAMASSESPRPAQLAFSVLRVNDYDLQIQHNEAVNLAVEHLGADRTKTDAFFQGTLGRELLSIVGFNHPCSPLDLQAVAHELEQRPEEQRDVVVVALGRELACEPWLADHNRVRPINRIRLIELRTDPKYGKFFEHQPAAARVRFEPEADTARVVIDDVISPSIIERLSAQEGVLTPQITDWRAMVDSVFIDAAYDGGVFNVALADIPERRQDLVVGSYIVERPANSMRPIAVRITDMLGEEVVVIEERAGH